jgi:hypothetical protein
MKFGIFIIAGSEIDFIVIDVIKVAANRAKFVRYKI